MQKLLNQLSAHERSAERLKEIYAKGLIPPEKKPFLIDLAASTGPYLAIDDGAEPGGLICDGASQIASVGLGFNAGALFGAAEHLASWTNQTGGDSYQAVRNAYEQLLQRKLGSDRFAAHFCASGAEGNETALGYLFEHRKNKSARKVLAFEGSFHGRMMVSLASTWNPAKREPFTWPGHESAFAPYPVMEGDDPHGPKEPEGWSALWSLTDDDSFDTALGNLQPDADALLTVEIESLSAVRKHITNGEVYAILIEPMQCEGGDRYSSRRFHQGLASLSIAFDIPLVYDEIQTGFGLGGEFFWHRMFCLQQPDGSPFFPAAVVCAKKAQAGIALVYDPDGPIAPSAATDVEQTSAASVARGYIQASVIDQFRESIQAIEDENRARLGELVARHSDKISHPRVKGMSFAFDLESGEHIAGFVGQRFQHGLLYYPAGAKTARFRMNLGFKQADSELFWSQMERALGASFEAQPAEASGSPIDSRARDVQHYFHYHERMLLGKLAAMQGQAPPSEADALEPLCEQLAEMAPEHAFRVSVITDANYAEYRERILAMQLEVYEPTRQSSAEEFDQLFTGEDALAIVATVHEEIVAMAFAGPLAKFRYMRGVPEDPHVEDPSAYYAMDLTIAKEHRGGLGRAMKQSLTLLALARGVTALHGRNRDRMAAAMWAINLSLGAHTTQYLVDDYPDQGAHRDCLYYRCETTWPTPEIDLGSGIEAPLGPEHLDEKFLRRAMPSLVNKLTLSNFVMDDFLSDLEQASHAFPEGLRRMYTASGLSEGVDKLVKVLWRHRQPRTGLLTIEGSDFGSGSFMARSLSGDGEAFFPTERLPQPQDASDERFFGPLAERLASDKLLGVFVEPLLRHTMQPIDPEALQRIVKMCNEADVPVVFNDTASMFYRYSAEAFAASGVEGARPDASIAYLGGQTALVACSDELFIEEPLLLISTWDGDAFSLAQFSQAMQVVEANPAAYESALQEYDKKLGELLSAQPGATTKIARGIGLVEGDPGEELRTMLRAAGEGRWLSCPSYSEMLRFNRAQA